MNSNGEKIMQDDNQNPKVYRISYTDEHGKNKLEIFHDSYERAKNRLEKFQQEYENYTEIKLIEIPSKDSFHTLL